MCCEECPKYEKCVEDNLLKNNCCPKCPEYYECVDLDDRDKDSFRDLPRGNNNKDYLWD